MFSTATQKVGVELGTSTDNDHQELVQQVKINFTSTLSYAERLLLKVSRRTDPPVSISEAQPSQDNRSPMSSRVDTETENDAEDTESKINWYNNFISSPAQSSPKEEFHNYTAAAKARET